MFILDFALGTLNWLVWGSTLMLLCLSSRAHSLMNLPGLVRLTSSPEP